MRFLLAVWVASLTAAFVSPAGAQDFITVASTTSTEQSGLFKHLLPEARKATGTEVRVVAVGTGQALDMGRRGDADVVFVHDRVAEEKFLSEGFGVKRYPVMYNDFVIVGPKSDPAGAKGGDVVAALKRIAAARAPFASRADKSGTHAAEMRYWKMAGIEPKGAWYRQTGSGMGPTLNTAAGMDAYALADRGTWLSFRNRADLVILVEGDKRLFNQYGVMLVNPARHPHVKRELGQRFIDWLVSPAGQEAIAAYRIDGQQLFFPDYSPGADGRRGRAVSDNGPMIHIDIRPLWRIRAGEEREFEFQLIEILAELDATAKLTAAAGRAGISYRHAWNLIEDWQRFFGASLVVKARGRGTSLTPLGKRLLLAGRRAQARLAPELANLASEFASALNASLSESLPTVVMHASHDFAIAGLHEMSRSRGIALELQYKGSFDALASLRRGECDVAGFHVPDGALGTLMRRRFAECLPPDGYRLISFATRVQGLIVRPGNPKAIGTVADLCRPDVRMVNRQRGSGTRALLEFMISSQSLDRSRMHGYDNEETTHAAVAALIAGHQADAGFGVQAAAAQYRLDFVPVCDERYYLACRAGDIESPAIASLMSMLRSPGFLGLIATLAGYRAADAGRVSASFEAAEGRAQPSGAPAVS